MSPYLISFLASFVYVGMKGFQHKNVNNNQYGLVVIFSFLMAAFDVFLVHLVVANGLAIAISAGFGAALGMVVSMKLHNTIFSKRKSV